MLISSRNASPEQQEGPLAGLRVAVIFNHVYRDDNTGQQPNVNVCSYLDVSDSKSDKKKSPSDPVFISTGCFDQNVIF